MLAATTRTNVLVRATDPILLNGVCMTLRTRPEVWLADEKADPANTVALVAADRFDDRTTDLLRTVQAHGFTKIVLIAGEVAEAEVLTAVESGVCAVARRAEATPDLLVRLVKGGRRR